MLSLIKTAFQSFEISEQVIILWTSFLNGQDTEVVQENFKEYVKNNKFPPTIHDLIKPNEEVRARREKEETRLRLQENDRLLQTIAPPPWEREGLTQREWMARILEKKEGAR